MFILAQLKSDPKNHSIMICNGTFLYFYDLVGRFFYFHKEKCLVLFARFRLSQLACGSPHPRGHSGPSRPIWTPKGSQTGKKGIAPNSKSKSQGTNTSTRQMQWCKWIFPFFYFIIFWYVPSLQITKKKQANTKESLTKRESN